MINNSIQWIKALLLYFKKRECLYYYRENTKQWIYEINLKITDYDYTGKFPHKFKWMCQFVWVKYFWNCVWDIYKISKNGIGDIHPGEQICSHPDKYFVSGLFGGYWCPKCNINVDNDCE
jgi:hypothetical protein